MPVGSRTPPIRALVHTWLVLDFFGQARRTGGNASTLTTTIFSQSFLALTVAVLLYPEPPPVPFAAANLCLSTLLVALGAFDVDQPAHRRLADRHLLQTSPLGRLPALLARIGHAAFATMLLTIGMALPPAILLACRQGQPLLAPAYLVAACCCAGLAIATLSITLRAVRRRFGGQAAALCGGTGKALLLGGGLAVFALSIPALQRNADALPIGRVGAWLLPPYHAAKVLADPAAESWRLLVGLLTGIVLLALSLLIGDGESDRKRRVARSGRLARLDRALAASRPEAGITAFTATMLWRSPGVRARTLPLLGVPAAVAFLAMRGGDGRSRALFSAMALSFPAVYLPFVIAMLGQADQVGSRWLFDSAPTLPLPRIRRAVWLALVTHLLLPVHCVAAVVLLGLGSAPAQLLPASLFAFAAGACMARPMLVGLGDHPFSRDDPPAGPDFGNLLAYGLALAGIGAALAAAPPLWQWAGAALAAAILVALAIAPRRPA